MLTIVTEFGTKIGVVYTIVTPARTMTGITDIGFRKIDFSVMQGLISDLTTFHLVKNIAQLKIVVDRSINASEEKKTVRFRQFNEALKLKLQGMMVPGKQQGKSLRKMIEEWDPHFHFSDEITCRISLTPVFFVLAGGNFSKIAHFVTTF